MGRDFVPTHGDVLHIVLRNELSEKFYDNKVLVSDDKRMRDMMVDLLDKGVDLKNFL